MGFSYHLPIGPLPTSTGVFGVYCILANTMAGCASSTRTGGAPSLAVVPQTNSLSGGIPQELEDLNLTALHLSGNSFSGCIPSGLRDVETNDLNLLGLDYCTSPES